MKKVVLLIPSSELESLQAFVQVSDGEILKVSNPRCGAARQAEEGILPAGNDETRAETSEQESSAYSLGSFNHGIGREESGACNFCLQNPCITTWAYGPPRPQNIGKRYKNYREYYKMLKRVGLWRNQLYTDRKMELGIFIDDVREVLPNCVVSDVRRRWPNPPDIPYKGHVPIMTQQ